MGEHERYKIEEIAEDGRPIAPVRHAAIFVSQCGVVVRDNIAIIIREWNKPKAGGVTFVDDRAKDMLWTTLMTNFTLPLEVDRNNNVIEVDQSINVIERKVKEWTLKKMAEQFVN